MPCGWASPCCCSWFEIDPAALIRNPGLWHLLDEGARVSEATGTLLCGTTALHRLARRLDRETALAVFRASGMA